MSAVIDCPASLPKRTFEIERPLFTCANELSDFDSAETGDDGVDEFDEDDFDDDFDDDFEEDAEENPILDDGFDQDVTDDEDEELEDE